MEIKTANIMTAMVTPFDDRGDIDYEKTKALIDYLLANGTQGLVVGGTTGESPTLTHDEKLTLYQKTVEFVAGRVPIIAGTGSNNTAETVAFTKEVSKIKGIAAALVVVPFYNKPSQAGLYEHFKAVANASDLPIMMYNVPGRTGISMDAKTTIRLAQFDSIIGTKECAGLDAMSEIIEGAPVDFLVYSGEDNLTFPAKCIGATGIISVASHVLGNEMAEMYRLLEEGIVADAARIHRNLVPKMNSLFTVSSPAPVKASLNQLGMSVGSLRLPLIPCTMEEEQAIFNALEI